MAGTETYGPFDSQPWADQTQWYRFGPAWSPSGVIDTPAASASAGSLGITFSALTPTLSAGRAWVRGTGYELSGGAKTMPAIAPNTNASLYRRDLIVLRRDLSAKTVTPVALQGTPSSTPTVPAMTQVETGQWDTPLHSFLVPPNSGTTITGIIDQRQWVDPGGLGRPQGLVSAGGQTSTQSANSTTQVRVVGPTNQTLTLLAGVAYRVRWESMAQADTVGAYCSVNVYCVAGANSPAVTDTLIADGGVPLDATGGPGAKPLNFTNLFTVASSGQYTASAYLSRAAGSGTVTISGFIHLEVEVAGLAGVISGFPLLP